MDRAQLAPVDLYLNARLQLVRADTTLTAAAAVVRIVVI